MNLSNRAASAITFLRAIVPKCHCWGIFHVFTWVILPPAAAAFLPGPPALPWADIQPPLEWWPLLPVPWQNWPALTSGALWPQCCTVPWEFSQSSPQSFPSFPSIRLLSILTPKLHPQHIQSMFEEDEHFLQGLYMYTSSAALLPAISLTAAASCSLAPKLFSASQETWNWLHQKKRNNIFDVFSSHCGRWDGGDGD